MKNGIYISNKVNKKRTKDTTKAICKVLECIGKERISEPVANQALATLEKSVALTVSNCSVYGK